MAASSANPKVDFYFVKAKKWQEELVTLRSIMLETGLPEELKWGCPCYTVEGKNVVLIHDFKDYFALLFIKGSLLKDPKSVLIQPTVNVQAGRQIRFTNLKEITKLKTTIKAYVREAGELEKEGAKVAFKKTEDFPLPEEFQKHLNKNAALKKAFYALTPGRQRGYSLFFSSAKQSATRSARVEKSIPDILNGKGLND
jgi:uncharacterized protein YdeI (YjbR/CyaY-like superfamily)